MRILLDTNIVLDVLLQRQPWFDEAASVWQSCDAGRNVGFVSVVTVTNVYYFGRKVLGSRAALQAVRAVLAAFEIVPADRLVLEKATKYPGSDYEDNVQIAGAIAASLDAIVTRDRTGFSHCPIPVLSPAELLARLNAP